MQTGKLSNLKSSWRTNPKLLRTLLKISLALNIFIILFFIGKKFYYNHYNLFHKSTNILSPPNDSIVTFTYNKIKSDIAVYQFYKMLPDDSGDIIFLGNSLTAGFPLQEMFQNIHIKNRGIGGNTSKDILKRLDEVTEGKPKKIFLEIGINDIAQGVSIDSLLNNVKQIVTVIKQETSESKIYIQPVFPTAGEQKIQIPKIEEYNKKLKDFCEKSNITFINLYPVFYKDGGLDTSLTTDGIHFNGKGYFLWKQQLINYIK